MSVDYEYLRPTLRVSMLKTLANNLSFYRGPIKLFEIGRIYLSQTKDLPEEREILAAIFRGPRTDEGWLGDNNEQGFFDAKGVVESLLSQLGLSGTFKAINEPFFHPNRVGEILIGEIPVGIVGEVHPVVLDQFSSDGGITAYIELDIQCLMNSVSTERSAVRPLYKYPTSIRDLSILVDRNVTSSEVENVIRETPLVDKAILFDAYDGEGIPTGMSSLAYRIYFQSPDKTLSSDEVGKAMDKVVRSLSHQLNATLRGRSVDVL